MTARKLVYYGLVVSPSIMLGFIGLGARAYDETYDFAHFDADQDQCARYYIGLIKAANELPITISSGKDVEMTRKTGQMWSNAVLSGQAKTIPTLDIDQSSSWTVCEEVSSAKTRLSWLMWRVAQKEIENKRYDQASKDLITSYVVCQATKGMNLFTISQACKRQSMILDRLLALAPYMSTSAKRSASDMIGKIKNFDRDSQVQMKLVNAEIKCARTYNVSETLGENESLEYWQRMYANSKRTMGLLESSWSTFNSSFERVASKTSPMPNELVYTGNPKPNQAYAPTRYVERLSPYGAGGMRPLSYSYAVAMYGH